jgi:DNA-binding LytR/AlgR family response regulator
LNSADVLFFEASKDYVKVVTAAKSHMVLITMKELQQKLKPELFLRISKSYIVNKEKITRVDNEKVHIQQYGFKVSRMLKKDITKQLTAAGN